MTFAASYKSTCNFVARSCQKLPQFVVQNVLCCTRTAYGFGLTKSARCSSVLNGLSTLYDMSFLWPNAESRDGKSCELLEPPRLLASACTWISISISLPLLHGCSCLISQQQRHFVPVPWSQSLGDVKAGWPLGHSLYLFAQRVPRRYRRVLNFSRSLYVL